MTPSLTVSTYDRTGFLNASDSTSQGKRKGAYNQYSTLKSNAKLFYIIEKINKSVKMEINGKTYTGIIEITKQIKDKNKCGLLLFLL